MAKRFTSPSRSLKDSCNILEPTRYVALRSEITNNALFNSLLLRALNKFASAVEVTSLRFESPIFFDLASTKYGGSSSNNINLGPPFKRLIQALGPGAFNPFSQ